MRSSSSSSSSSSSMMEVKTQMTRGQHCARRQKTKHQLTLKGRGRGGQPPHRSTSPATWTLAPNPWGALGRTQRSLTASRPAAPTLPPNPTKALGRTRRSSTRCRPVLLKLRQNALKMYRRGFSGTFSAKMSPWGWRVGVPT